MEKVPELRNNLLQQARPSAVGGKWFPSARRTWSENAAQQRRALWADAREPLALPAATSFRACCTHSSPSKPLSTACSSMARPCFAPPAKGAVVHVLAAVLSFTAATKACPLGKVSASGLREVAGRTEGGGARARRLALPFPVAASASCTSWRRVSCLSQWKPSTSFT